MMRKKIVLIITALAAPSRLNAESICSQDPQVANIHHYIMANFEQFGGNLPQAYELYKQLTSHQAPLHAYRGYIHLLHEVGAHPEIIRVMQDHGSNFKDDSAIQLIFARALHNTGKQQEAAELFIKLNETFKDNQEIAFEVAQQYLTRKEPSNAISVIDNFLSASPLKPNNFAFHFLKAQIYVNLGDKHKALHSIKQCLDLYPHFDKGWILYGMLHEQAGELAQAIKGYSTFLDMSQERNQQLEQHLLGLIFRQKLLEQKSHASSASCPSTEKAIQLLNEKKYKEALECIDQCLSKNTHNYEQRLLKLQILSSMQEYETASKLLHQWISEENNNRDWLKALHTLGSDKTFRPHAINTLHSLEKNYNHPLLIALYLADIYTRDQAYKKALEQHHQAISLTADPLLKSKIYYQIALIHFQQQEYTDMEKALEQGQRLQENFPPLLNLLAYHYASTKRTKQAQELMNIVLKKDKNNPHMWDTQALIYYKQGNYDKAEQILQKIVKSVPSDFTAVRHLAKTEYKRGNIEQARAHAQQALTLASSPYEQEKCKKYLSCWTTKKN